MAAAVRGYIEDAGFAARHGYPAFGAFAAALAVARLGPAEEQESAYRRERLWQADWIARVVIAGS